MPRERYGTHGLRLFALLCLFTLPTVGQGVPVALSPVAHQQFLDAQGHPLSGGKVFTYNAGTTTPAATYVDINGIILNSNPIILDSGGFATIYLANQEYKICVQDQFSVQQWCQDFVSAFQTVVGTQSIVFAGVTSDPTGVAGAVDFRSDIPCLRFFTSVWDCFATLNATQIFTNKTYNNAAFTGTATGFVAATPTLTTPTLTTPIINGASTGTGIQGTGTKLLTAGALAANTLLCTDVNGTAQTGGCTNPTVSIANFVAKAQVAAIGSTAVYTCSVLGPPSTCHVRANYYIVTQTAGTGTTAFLSILWNDGETSIAETVSSGTIALGALGAIQQGSVFIQLANGGTVNYSTTVAAIGTSKYSIYVYIEQL